MQSVFCTWRLITWEHRRLWKHHNTGGINCVMYILFTITHQSIVCNRFIPFMESQGFFFFAGVPVSGRGQGTPWTSCQLIAGPSLMAEGAMQGANHTSGAIWGSVSCSRTLWLAAQLSPELGFEPAITSQPALPAELQPPLFQQSILHIHRCEMNEDICLSGPKLMC